MSLARRLLEFRFKGIFCVEVKSFARFTFGRKSSGVITLSEWTFEEFKSGTGKLSVPKNSEKSLVPFRLDTSSKIITLGWRVGRAGQNTEGAHKNPASWSNLPLNPSPCCRISRHNPPELANHYPRVELNLLASSSRLSRNACIHYPNESRYRNAYKAELLYIDSGVLLGDTFLSSLGNCGVPIFLDHPTRFTFAFQ